MGARHTGRNRHVGTDLRSARGVRIDNVRDLPRDPDYLEVEGVTKLATGPVKACSAEVEYEANAGASIPQHKEASSDGQSHLIDELIANLIHSTRCGEDGAMGVLREDPVLEVHHLP